MQIQDLAVLPSRFPEVPSTPTSSQSQDERWADLVDETITPRTAREQMAAREQMTDGSLSVYPTVGSQLHDSGRCKPCAFFHTKGCNSGVGCLFCHLCPAHEKQRRKRLARQLCHTNLSPSDAHHTGYKGHIRAKYGSFKSGHSRQGSNESNSTASTCTGWSSDGHELQHSRQSPIATQKITIADSNVVGAYFGQPQYQDSQALTMFSNSVDQSHMVSSPQGMLQSVISPVVPVSPTASMTIMHSNLQSEHDGVIKPMGNFASHDCVPMIENSQEQMHLQKAINNYGSVISCSTETAVQQGKQNLNLAAAISGEASPVNNLSSSHAVQMPMPPSPTCALQGTIAAPAPQLMTPMGPNIATSFANYGGVQYVLVPVEQPYDLTGAYPVQMPDMQMALPNDVLAAPNYQCSNDCTMYQIYDQGQVTTSQVVQNTGQFENNQQAVPVWW